MARFFRTIIQNACTEFGTRAGVNARIVHWTSWEMTTCQMRRLVLRFSIPYTFIQMFWRLYNAIIALFAKLVRDNEFMFVRDGPLHLAPLATFDNCRSHYLCQSFRIRLTPLLISSKLITVWSPHYYNKTRPLLVGDPSLEEVLYLGTKLNPLLWKKKWRWLVEYSTTFHSLEKMQPEMKSSKYVLSTVVYTLQHMVGWKQEKFPWQQTVHGNPKLLLKKILFAMIWHDSRRVRMCHSVLRS